MLNKSKIKELEKYLNEIEIDLSVDELNFIHENYKDIQYVKTILNYYVDVVHLEHLDFITCLKLGTAYFDQEVYLKYDTILYKLGHENLSKAQVAEFLNVNRETFRKWTKYDSVLLDHVSRGVGNKTEKVVNKLIELACEGNINAIKFYLTNVDSANWTDGRVNNTSIKIEQTEANNRSISEYEFLFSSNDNSVESEEGENESETDD